MKLGIDILLDKELSLLKNKRIGILAHKASIAKNGKHIVNLIKDDYNLTTIFGPEHGLTSFAQDMEPVKDIKEQNIPIYSLYGDSFESLSPKNEMLENIDVLVIDLQDIGSRYYTYIWTTIICLQACKKNNKQVIIFDRPNPINGLSIEGSLIQKSFESFVGLFSIPVRHAMTIGEIANYINKEYSINCDLKIIPMYNWKRNWMWNKTRVQWHNPSPNMRSLEACLLYPGMCLIEGTNLSEGRGTDTPFELIGAPFIDSKELILEFEKLNLSGINAHPFTFTPLSQKWANQTCNGIKWEITDSNNFKPYYAGLAFIWCVNKLYKNKGFEWRTETYEFVKDKPAIDLLTGSSYFRENIDNDIDFLGNLIETPSKFLEKRKKYLLY